MNTKHLDKFTRYKHNITRTHQRYHEIKKELDLAKGQEGSLCDLAKPFEQGYFTLGVMGKVSSGKSSFINALLRYDELLPTGANQTTLGITCIRHADTPRVEITYGDGHNQTITTNIQEGLKKAVSVNGFQNFPITLVDDLLLEKNTPEEIMSRYPQLKDQSRMEFEESVLKTFLESRKVEDIPVAVTIYSPLPEMFRNWQILDTPGVGAIGGMENKTYDLMNEKTGDKTFSVDAIVFVVRGTDAAEETGNIEFIRKTINNLNPIARKRLFMVATHFYGMKESDRWQEIFMTQLEGYIQKERLFLLDSFIEGLRQQLISSKIDIHQELVLTKNQLPSWSKEQSQDYRDILRVLGGRIDDEGLPKNNQAYWDQLERYGRFTHFRASLDRFVEAIRGAHYQEYLRVLKEDLETSRELKKKDFNAVIRGLDNQLGILLGDRSKLEKSEQEYADEAEREKNARVQFSKYLLKIKEQDYSRRKVESTFAPFKDRIKEIQQYSEPTYKTVEGIARQLEVISSELDEKYIDLLDDLQKALATALKGYQVEQDVTLPQLDFGALRKEAIEAATKEYTCTERNYFIMFLTLGMFGTSKVKRQEIDYKQAQEQLLKDGENKITDHITSIVNGVEAIIKNWHKAIEDEMKAAERQEIEAIRKRNEWIKSLSDEAKVVEEKARSEKQKDSCLTQINTFIQEVEQLSNE
jgi:hypothetical protein